MAVKFSGRMLAVAAAAALSFGSMGAASAADASGSLASLGGGLGSLGGKQDLSVPTGKKVKLGNVGGPAFNADVYTQIHGASTVEPGAEVKVRVEVQGVVGQTRIDEIIDWMPEGFELQKVERMKDGLLGSNVATLKQNEYAVNTSNGRQEVRVSWADGLIFKTKPTVTESAPLIVDFTWKAPQKEGTYNNGAGIRVGSVVNNFKVFDNAEPIVVQKGVAPVGSSGAAGSSSQGGRGALGSLG